MSLPPTEEKKSEKRGCCNAKLLFTFAIILTALVSAAITAVVCEFVLREAPKHEVEGKSTTPKSFELITINTNHSVKVDIKSKGLPIIYNYGDNDLFEMCDVTKGIHLVRSGKHGFCFLTSMEKKPVNKNVNSFGGTGSEMDKESEGKSKTSAKEANGNILTQRALNECANGYMWITDKKSTLKHRQKGEDLFLGNYIPGDDKWLFSGSWSAKKQNKHHGLKVYGDKDNLSFGYEFKF